ncbi:MAG: hypothetical protein M1813_002794 [Trichoglossum hirsutum]|nr:MAG: hypothetical protein M1813_002794 [Trichoglossum hirsutum]
MPNETRLEVRTAKRNLRPQTSLGDSKEGLILLALMNLAIPLIPPKDVAADFLKKKELKALKILQIINTNLSYENSAILYCVFIQFTKSLSFPLDPTKEINLEFQEFSFEEGIIRNATDSLEGDISTIDLSRRRIIKDATYSLWKSSRTPITSTEVGIYWNII